MAGVRTYGEALRRRIVWRVIASALLLGVFVVFLASSAPQILVVLTGVVAGISIIPTGLMVVLYRLADPDQLSRQIEPGLRPTLRAQRTKSADNSVDP